MEAQTPTAPARLLDSETKKRIKNWVLGLRKLLEEDLARELKRLGIERGQAPLPPSKLDYLTDEERAIRRHLDALLAHETKAEGSPEAGYDAVRREIAYTFLNRLVGLRCMEARALLFVDGEQTEVVTTRPEYGGRSRLLRDLRAAAGSKYKDPENGDSLLLRDGLEKAFVAVTEEIRVLFDPHHEYSRLWPSFPKLQEVIRAINEGLPNEVFASPDFLGWVYQFFNAEEKERIRGKTKGKPTTPYELAVINQFYTPDWIVKSLVDNTLGRVWVQMHADTRLRRRPDQPDFRRGPGIDYLVPGTGEDDRQEMRPVRDLKLLDPACGTMHFGQYAFALLYEMYLEELERAGTSGWPDEPSVKSAEAIPNAILEHNLFGIDIDARAIQIAALALLLTAKEVGKAHGRAPSLVRVRKMNLVVASAVPVGQEELTKFLERANGRIGNPALRRELIGTIWRHLQDVSELGSLIRIGEDLEATIRRWLERSGGLLRAHDEAEAMRLKDTLFEALHLYAAENRADDVVQRLFAEDTARGFLLLDVLSHRYDAIVMNPPYGSPTARTCDIVDRLYPAGRNDIYCAFVLRGLQLLRPSGYLGALTSRGFFTGPRPLDYRRAILQPPQSLVFLADLGPGILDDAAVNTCAYVLGPQAGEAITIYDLELDRELRERTFVDALGGNTANRVYQHKRRFFLDIADNRLAYRLLRSLEYGFREFGPMFEEYLTDPNCVGTPNFVPKRCAIVQGPIPVPLERFVRYHWELPSEKRNGWLWVVKGGEFNRFFYSEELLLDWRDDGYTARSFAKEKYGSESRTIKNQRYFGRGGLTFPRVSSVGFSCRELPEGFAFTDSGPAIVCRDSATKEAAFAVLNSSLALVALAQLNSSRKTEINDLALFPLAASVGEEAPRFARRMQKIKREWNRGMETSRDFDLPQLLKFEGNLRQRLEAVMGEEQGLDAELAETFARLDETAFTVYRISEEDKIKVRDAIGSIPSECVWPEMRGRSSAQRRMEHVWRLLAFCVKRVIEGDDDGIVPLVKCTSEPPLEERVLAVLGEILGTERLHDFEGEVISELRKKVAGYKRAESIRDWLSNVYFEYHARVYRNRPVYWHLASSQHVDPAFGVLAHYHRFGEDALRKLRGTYVRGCLERLERELGHARRENRASDAVELQQKIEEVRALDRVLQRLEEGEFPIRVPWKKAEEQPKGWQPNFDDGVRVNIVPFQNAGVLRVAKVVSGKGIEEDEE